MSKSARMLLIAALTLVGLAAIPPLLLYALGWRVSLQDRSLVKTGALALFPFPYGVNAALEGYRSKTTSAITPKAYFPNVKPGVKNVRVTRQGFTSWEKTARIEPERTVIFPFVQLWPQTPETGASRTIEIPARVFPSPSHNFVAVASPQSFMMLGSTELTLLFSAPDITAENLVWANRDPRAIIEFPNGTAAIADLRAQTAPRIIPVPASFRHTRLRGDGNMLAAMRGGDLVVIALDGTLGPPRVLSRNILGFGWMGTKLVAVQQNGILWFVDSENPEQQLQISEWPLEDPGSRVSVITHEGKIAALAHDQKTLWMLEPESSKPERLGDLIEGFEFAPSGEKMLLRTAQEVRVRFLKERREQPARKKGEETLVLRTTETILHAAFAPGEEYVLVATQDRIRAFELDDRGGRNSAEIVNEDMHGAETELRTRSLFVVFGDGRLVRFKLLSRPAIDIGGAIGL